MNERSLTSLVKENVINLKILKPNAKSNTCGKRAPCYTCNLTPVAKEHCDISRCCNLIPMAKRRVYIFNPCGHTI